MPEPSADPPAPRPTVLEIFLAFAGIAAVGFGGVLPWARRMLVERRRWLTPEEFVEVLSLGQFLPGGNILNVGIVVGERFRGALGALAAALGLLAAPTVIVLLLGAVYLRYQHAPGVQEGLMGVAAAAIGLIVAMVIKMAEPVLRRRAIVPMAFAVATFVAVGLLRIPLPVVVLVLAPLSIAYAWTRTA
jgi:chromate transporter